MSGYSWKKPLVTASEIAPWGRSDISLSHSSMTSLSMCSTLSAPIIEYGRQSAPSRAMNMMTCSWIESASLGTCAG